MWRPLGFPLNQPGKVYPQRKRTPVNTHLAPCLLVAGLMGVEVFVPLDVVHSRALG